MAGAKRPVPAIGGAGRYSVGRQTVAQPVSAAAPAIAAMRTTSRREGRAAWFRLGCLSHMRDNACSHDTQKSRSERNIQGASERLGFWDHVRTRGPQALHGPTVNIRVSVGEMPQPSNRHPVQRAPISRLFARRPYRNHLAYRPPPSGTAPNSEGMCRLADCTRGRGPAPIQPKNARSALSLTEIVQRGCQRLDASIRLTSAAWSSVTKGWGCQ